MPRNALAGATAHKPVPRVLILSTALILIQLAISLAHPKSGWDDGSITASFSRTFAISGKIALTPGSTTVEGFSSLLWFLLMLPAGLINSELALLVWMKVLAALFATAATVLIYKIAEDHFENEEAAAIATVMYALLLTTLGEIHNGMEMNASAFLLLLLFRTLSRNGKRTTLYASLIDFLLLLNRFETPFCLALIMMGFAIAFARGEHPRVALQQLFYLGVVLLCAFACIGIWRHRTFGLWMPNTVYAKRFPPYRDWTTPKAFLVARYDATAEVMAVLGPPILVSLGVVVWAAFRNRTSLSRLKKIHSAIWVLAVGCFLWGFLAGTNWGYPGRMIAGMLPFLLLCIVNICVLLVPDQVLLRRVLLGILLLHLAPLRRFRIPLVGPTVAMVEPGGTGADMIRTALHQDRIQLMTEDVGASSLCCAKINFIDSGLLSDPTLAHTGWAGVSEYFRKTNPEVVETHGNFQRLAGFYKDHLLDNYSAVGAEGRRFFVRNDLFEKLRSQHSGVLVPIVDAPACLPPDADDKAYSESRNSCLVLDDKALQNNFH